jgi:hypothetical protein
MSQKFMHKFFIKFLKSSANLLTPCNILILSKQMYIQEMKGLIFH